MHVNWLPRGLSPKTKEVFYCDGVAILAQRYHHRISPRSLKTGQRCSCLVHATQLRQMRNISRKDFILIVDLIFNKNTHICMRFNRFKVSIV